MNSDWFHDLDKEDHINFYKKIYQLWNTSLNLSIKQKNSIVPGCNGRNKLFKFYIDEIEKKEENILRKTNLSIINRLISSGTDKIQCSLGVIYILMALAHVNENVAEAYDWIATI